MDSEDKEVKTVPEKVKMEKPESLAGRFVILWIRDKNGKCDTGTPVKVLSVDTEKHEITYNVVGGVSKGKTCKGTYDPSQTVEVYDEDNVILVAFQ